MVQTRANKRAEELHGQQVWQASKASKVMPGYTALSSFRQSDLTGMQTSDAFIKAANLGEWCMRTTSDRCCIVVELQVPQWDL